MVFYSIISSIPALVMFSFAGACLIAYFIYHLFFGKKNQTKSVSPMNSTNLDNNSEVPMFISVVDDHHDDDTDKSASSGSDDDAAPTTRHPHKTNKNGTPDGFYEQKKHKGSGFTNITHPDDEDSYHHSNNQSVHSDVDDESDQLDRGHFISGLPVRLASPRV